MVWESTLGSDDSFCVSFRGSLIDKAIAILARDLGATPSYGTVDIDNYINIIPA